MIKPQKYMNFAKSTTTTIEPTVTQQASGWQNAQDALLFQLHNYLMKYANAWTTYLDQVSGAVLNASAAEFGTTKDSTQIALVLAYAASQDIKTIYFDADTWDLDGATLDFSSYIVIMEKGAIFNGDLSGVTIGELICSKQQIFECEVDEQPIFVSGYDYNILPDYFGSITDEASYQKIPQNSLNEIVISPFESTTDMKEYLVLITQYYSHIVLLPGNYYVHAHAGSVYGWNISSQTGKKITFLTGAMLYSYNPDNIGEASGYYVMRISNSSDIEIHHPVIVGDLDTHLYVNTSSDRVISAVSDYGDGTVKITTSTAHGLSDDDIVKITSTTSYNGNYAVKVIDTTHFWIIAAYVSSQTGIMREQALAGEGGHGIAILGTSNNIKLISPDVYKCWGDGLYIMCSDTAISNIYVSNGKFTYNRRNGISVICADGLSLIDCESSFNGIGITGTSPQAGLDIEPNTSSQNIKNIVIENFKTSYNAGCGIIIALLQLRNKLIGNVTIDISKHYSLEDGGAGFFINRMPSGSGRIIESVLNNGDGTLNVTTSTAHGLANPTDTAIIMGTTDITTEPTDTDHYDGTYTSTYVDDVTFKITHAYSGTRTGVLYKPYTGYALGGVINYTDAVIRESNLNAIGIDEYRYNDSPTINIVRPTIDNANNSRIIGLFEGVANNLLITNTIKIAQFFNYNDTVAGTVRVYSVAHGLSSSNSVKIYADGYYLSGPYTITKIDDDNFYFSETWQKEAVQGAFFLNSVSVGSITITSTAHGLYSGDKITSFGTTNYNKASVPVIRLTADTFAINETYVSSESGQGKVWYKTGGSGGLLTQYGSAILFITGSYYSVSEIGNINIINPIIRNSKYIKKMTKGMYFNGISGAGSTAYPYIRTRYKNVRIIDPIEISGMLHSYDDVEKNLRSFDQIYQKRQGVEIYDRFRLLTHDFDDHVEMEYWHPLISTNSSATKDINFTVAWEELCLSSNEYTFVQTNPTYKIKIIPRFLVDTALYTQSIMPISAEAGKYIQSTALGCSITIKQLLPTVFIVTNMVGTWNVET